MLKEDEFNNSNNKYDDHFRSFYATITKCLSMSVNNNIIYSICFLGIDCPWECLSFVSKGRGAQITNLFVETVLLNQAIKINI